MVQTPPKEKETTNPNNVKYKNAVTIPTACFGNISVPKSAVFNGTSPIIHIDDQQAQNQGTLQPRIRAIDVEMDWGI
ncbi:MAG: hypothetical protein ABSF65_06320 [Candidatus Bathyarchaeia archaeon]|jgi:hypothetical protein